DGRIAPERVEGGAEPLDHLGHDQVQRGPVEGDPGHAVIAVDVDEIRHQYRFIFGSTAWAQKSSPPARFTALNPCWRRKFATAALRTPWWQYTTISSAGSSSAVRNSISSIGICVAFSRRHSAV